MAYPDEIEALVDAPFRGEIESAYVNRLNEAVRSLRTAVGDDADMLRIITRDLSRYAMLKTRLADVEDLRSYSFGQRELGIVPRGDHYIVKPGEPLTQTTINSQPEGTVFRFVEGVHRPAAPEDQGDGLFYSPGLIPVGKGFTFVGDPGAIVDGSLEIPSEDWVVDGTHWYAPNQTQRLPTTVVPSWQMCLLTEPMCNTMEDFWYNGQWLHHVATREELGPGKVWLDTENNRVYISDDPDGAVIERGVSPYFLLGNDDNHGTVVSNLIIQKFSNVPEDGPIRGKRWTIEDSEFRYNHGMGLRCDESHVRNVTVNNNGQQGFGGQGRGIIVEYSETAHNNQLHYNHSWSAGGSKWAFTEDLLVQHVYAHDNHGGGLWTDISNYNTVYRRCLSEWNSRIGIFHEISHKALIEDCIAAWNGYDPRVVWWAEAVGISISNSDNVTMRNNLSMFNAGGPYAIVGSSRPEEDEENPWMTEKYGPWRLRNATYTGNVGVLHGATVHLSALDGSGMEHAGLTVDDVVEDRESHFDGTYGHMIDDNVYIVPSHPGWELGQWFLGLDETGVTRPLFKEEWQAHGFDENSTFDTYELPDRLTEYFRKPSDDGLDPRTWQVYRGPNGLVRVTKGRAEFEITSAWNSIELIPRVVGTSGTLKVKLQRQTGATESRVSLWLRGEGGMSAALPRTGYHMEVVYGADDLGTAYIWRKLNGSSVFLTSLTNIPSEQDVWIEFQVEGNVVRGRWYLPGAEPLPAWTSVTDSATPALTRGRPRLGFASGTATAIFRVYEVSYEEGVFA